MNREDQKKLRSLRRELERTEAQSPRQRVSDSISRRMDSPGSSEQDFVNNYILAKRDSVSGNFPAARDCLVTAERMPAGSRAIRYFISKRLTLLKARTRPIQRDITDTDFELGFASIHGIGNVPVLGRYNTYGPLLGLKEAILILKKAPEEMDLTTENARPELIRGLASLLLPVIGISSFADKIDVIIPIPPDSDRYSVRGYHPPDELSKWLSSQSTIPVTLNTLEKIRSTEDLRGLNRQERFEVIKDSMGVTEQKAYLVDGMDVLLIDDVVTYGTHFNEARNKLLMAGARAVHGAALATARNNFTPLDA